MPKDKREKKKHCYICHEDFKRTGDYRNDNYRDFDEGCCVVERTGSVMLIYNAGGGQEIEFDSEEELIMWLNDKIPKPNNSNDRYKYIGRHKSLEEIEKEKKEEGNGLCRGSYCLKNCKHNKKHKKECVKKYLEGWHSGMCKDCDYNENE